MRRAADGSGGAVSYEAVIEDVVRVVPIMGRTKVDVVLRETVGTRESSGGRFVSVRVTFRAESREQYDVAHAVLRGHPEVKWTL